MHLEIIYAGSPKRHKFLLESIKNRKYEIRGKHRKGVHTPFVTEVKLYDIRIKKECVPQFLADYGIMTEIAPKQKGTYVSGSYNRLFTTFIWVFRKIFALGTVKTDKKPAITLSGHSTAYLVGTIADMEEDGNEIL